MSKSACYYLPVRNQTPKGQFKKSYQNSFDSNPKENLNETFIEKCSYENEKENKDVNLLCQINSKKKLLMQSLMPFYLLRSNLEVFLSIVKGKSKLSLRVIDFFVTNYSRMHGTNYSVKKKPMFIVHDSYRAQLKSYSKKDFDPFCRRERIIFKIDGQKIRTTVAQLNFFRWAITYNIINYILKNRENIENEMISCSKKKNKKKCKLTKTLKTTAISGNKGIMSSDIQFTISATKKTTKNKISFEVKFANNKKES